MQSGSAMGTEAPAAGMGWSVRGWAAEDVLAMLWRERTLMLAVFICVAALGLLVAFKQKTYYPAHSSLLIRLGEEYVYNPVVGDAARGTAPDTDSIVQSEVEILSSAALKARVINDIGLPRLFPGYARRYASADAYKRRDIESAAIKAIETNLKVSTTPGSAIVRLVYTHPDPQMAATVLNTLIDEYLNYRRSVLIDQDAGLLDQQRRAFQGRLDQVETAYQKFLSDNGISDFDTEKTSLAQIYAQLLSDRYNVQVRLSETEGQLGATSKAVSSAAPEIGLYQDVDHTAADKLLQMRIDRQDLLARYKPDAAPVRDMDRRIAELERLAGSPQGVGAGVRRVGPNPVYQTLQTEQTQLESTAASLRSRQRAIAAELEQVGKRRLQLTALEPHYQDLSRQREVLSSNVRSLTAREQESQAQQAISAKAADNVRVVERAYVPTTGKSLKKPLAALALLFAAFTAACAGLLHALLAGSRRPMPAR